MAPQYPQNPSLPLPEATALISQHRPEPVREHWCLIGSERYPAKQAYHLLTGLPRSQFTSHQALSGLRSAGFTTSSYRRGSTSRTEFDDAITDEFPGDSGAAFEILSTYLAEHRLTHQIADAEKSFLGADRERSEDVVAEYLFSEDLLDAALEVRKHVGRLNDVIHATVIARTLPLLLEPGERVAVRPSLGAGNDPSRPYDLETDRRIAEFKVAQWKGADAMRKRGVFTDLVHLALDDSDRRTQLFVVGMPPARFLNGSTATAKWGLERASARTRQRFQDAFGAPEDMTIAGFRAGPARHVEIVDLATLLPSLR